jgi:hypothetical protein
MDKKNTMPMGMIRSMAKGPIKKGKGKSNLRSKKQGGSCQ